MTFEPSPEGIQSFSAFAVAHEDHGPAFQVQNHGQIAVSFADTDFIDGDLLELVQLRAGKASQQVPFLNIFNEVPTDAQMLGYVFDGHVPGQPQGIAGKASGVTASPEGKTDLHLAQDAAEQTPDSWHQQFKPNGLVAYGKCAKAAHYLAPALNLMGAAFRTAQGEAVLANPKMDSPIMILGMNMLVSPNAEAMIK